MGYEEVSAGAQSGNISETRKDRGKVCMPSKLQSLLSQERAKAIRNANLADTFTESVRAKAH